MKKHMSYGVLVITVALLFVANIPPLFAAKTDDRVESSARKSYVFRAYLKGDDIKIDVRNGIATLTGTVADESHRILAGDMIASLSGVAEVENKLIARDKIPADDTNASLASKVNLLLSLHRNVNATGTEVIARNGTVTLRGKVSSMIQRDLTTEYVKDVDGVKTVKSEMTVSSAVVMPDEKTIFEKMAARDEAIDDVSITVLVEMMLLNHRSTSALTPIVQTKEGVVRLKGNARNAATKELISTFVNDVHGVKRVINTMSFE